ncbi:MAG: hypothetical protein VCF24_00500, partial [Candidatus Latescibacterota bacterium]
RRRALHRRLASICRECDEIYSNLDIKHFRGRASFEFLRSDRLLDVVAGLVGSEITCSPVQHTRAKLPEGLAPSEGDPHITPWHQDAGAFDVDADPHFVLTCGCRRPRRGRRTDVCRSSRTRTMRGFRSTGSSAA